MPDLIHKCAGDLAHLGVPFPQEIPTPTTPMILALIVSKNLARRHLNPGQKAFLGLKYLEIFEATAKETESDRKTKPAPWEESQVTVADLPPEAERKSTSLRVTDSDTESQVTSADLRSSPSTKANEGKSTAKAAEAVGASGRAVQQAKAVQRDAPGLDKACLVSKQSQRVAHRAHPGVIFPTCGNAAR